MKKYILIILLVNVLYIPMRAQLAKENTENPPAEGFNLLESDARAIQIADEVMKAMGGRQNWDNTRYISWNFFGRRKLLWDKWQGDVRIEVDSTIYLVNIAKNTGKVKKGNEIITHPDSLQKYVDRGISIWINDSYWLVMPFKLKDSGVTLKYIGERNTAAAKPADVLQLTFQNVGRTPENKYWVYVDKDSRLVTQWEYYQKYTDEKPQIVNPWENYKKQGNILLSGDRGENRKLTDIAVYNNVPESAFTSFNAVNYSNLK
ncbi:MAG: hypothetical protein ACK4TA_23465, partial [Saprospiraceae bacterium]